LPPERGGRRALRTVLIANRGEIAVRVARACRDAGLRSVAVYVEPERDALHVRLADEAYALDGAGAAGHLDAGGLLRIAARAGADAVHPGYGFLAEQAGFAQAVLDAGLVWIGPPPAAIRALGDKVRARGVAARVGAPLVPGTLEPVEDARTAEAFARYHGFPVAIKAVHGGGGRGLRVARAVEEVAVHLDAAAREATTAFGRGECFVERYLDRARHVETQCLADVHGGVVVVSTRDCTVQRRHQKLVEEAPAPFLAGEQVEELYRASRAILSEVGYVGAGTCEFLVAPGGAVTFLEANARLQVEHPVSEEVTGIDLVREQLRIADGQRLGYDDPPARGHALEFRVNGEDPGRGFLPASGTVTRWRPPSGPGVRVDAGVEEGSVVGQAFDSLLAKLVVTGADRAQALERSRRALAEFEVEGLPTALPFHRALVEHPAFVASGPGDAFRVHTRWIENEFEGAIPPHPGPAAPAPDPAALRRVVVEVDGRRLEVVLPAELGAPRARRLPARPAPPAAATSASPPRRAAPAAVAASAAVVSPMQGCIVAVAVGDGQLVREGDVVVVLEAMKMEQPIAAHRSGTIAGLTVRPGVVVPAGAVICEIRG
jgi:acetyl-CoA/propionyl-CoA carboxylase biotin carboxyl carrier protein